MGAGNYGEWFQDPVLKVTLHFVAKVDATCVKCPTKAGIAQPLLAQYCVASAWFRDPLSWGAAGRGSCGTSVLLYSSTAGNVLYVLTFHCKVDMAPLAVRKSAYLDIGGLDETTSEPGECGTSTVTPAHIHACNFIRA